MVAIIGVGLTVLFIVVALVVDLAGCRDDNRWPPWLYGMAFAALGVAYLAQKGVL